MKERASTRPSRPGKPRTRPNHRKTESSRPGLPMPDVRGTTEQLVQLLEDDILARLQAGTASHLVVAEKEPQVHRLPPLPAARTSGSYAEAPATRAARGLRDSWHKDQFNGFVYVVRGEADLLLCRKVLSCRQGDFIFLMPQTWRNSGNVSHWERPYIEHADSELLWVFFSQDGASIHVCRSRGEQHARSPVLFIPDGNVLALLELFSREAAEPQISGAITQLLWLIFERTLRKLRDKRAVPSSQVLTHESRGQPQAGAGERARQYVEANLSEKLTLAIVARAVHVSRTKLAQEFTAVNGETFGAYVLRRRLEQARHLLRTTTLPVTHISWMTGFSNADYFSRTFRRYTGIKPTHFREKN